jgi:hypothetical protein
MVGRHAAAYTAGAAFSAKGFLYRSVSGAAGASDGRCASGTLAGALRVLKR